MRICYHRNCVTFDFHHQISLVEDLVFQLTIALQLNGEQLVVIGSIFPNCHDELAHGDLWHCNMMCAIITIDTKSHNDKV